MICRNMGFGHLVLIVKNFFLSLRDAFCRPLLGLRRIMASKKKEEGDVKEEIVLTDIPVADTPAETDCWASYKLSMQIDMNTTLHKLIELLGAGMLITITMLDGKRKRFILVDVEENNGK
jgi:hypothetical protein